MEVRALGSAGADIVYDRTVDADEAVCHRSVSSKILGHTRYTLSDQRKSLKSIIPPGRIIIVKYIFSASNDGLHVLWAVRKAHPCPAKRFHVRDL